jgi:arylsulfatase A-like enzyme
MVRWPGKVAPGTSAALVSQVDFTASLAALVGQSLPTEGAPDSCNVLPALLGESPDGRKHVVEQGGPLALREGPWKFIPDGPGIGESSPKGSVPPGVMLFNLDDDPGERSNLAAQKPEKIDKMAKLLREVRTSGRDQPPGWTSGGEQ